MNNSKQSKLLVTTALEETWGTDENIIFLGEWCKKYSRKHRWANRESTTTIWHWKDQEKLKKDHDYLNDLYESILVKVAEKLNSVHDVSFPLRYWRIIVGPWLLTYVSILWDRWETIRMIASNREQLKTIIPREIPSRYIAKDFGTFMQVAYEDDAWNYLIYTDVLQTQNISALTLIKEEVSPKLNIRFKKLRRFSLKFCFAKLFDRFAKLLRASSSYKILLYKSYLSPIRLFQLNVKLKQIPRAHFEFQKELREKKVKGYIRSEFGKKLGKTNFECFLYQNIFLDMPKAYLEEYQAISSYCETLPNANVIVTANAHFSGEIFKNWAANQVDMGSKLIISEHGGALPSRMSVFCHETKICDKRIVWGVPLHGSEIQLPPNKIKGGNSGALGSNILLVGLELPRYSCRCQSGPNSSLMVEEINQKIKFVDSLNTNSKDNFKIRPYPTGGWEIGRRFIDLYGSNVISTNNKMLSQDYTNSKIIVCSYPQTTFSEAMHSGIPTIMLYLDKYWELVSEFDCLIEKLKHVKIIHTNPISAATHINTVCNNPLQWWDKEETKEARDLFFEMCGKTSGDAMSEWANFLKSELE
jgi:putative transferase (TIGR04331 family)